MQSPTCEKCGTKIQIWKCSDTIKCKDCGAFYKSNSGQLEEQHIDYMFDFVGFECIYSSTLNSCSNTCPAPEMYCVDHVSDEDFETARSSILYAEKRLGTAKDVLERMEESKKIYLIQEVSGINEQDDSV